MKTKFAIPFALLAACAVLAAALPARAETVELVTNGKPAGSLDGWINTGPDRFEWYDDGDDAWFKADGDNCIMVQTIVLADKGITPEFIAAGPTVTASVISQGGSEGEVLVTQLDADGRGLALHVVVAVHETSATKSHSIDFKLTPDTRSLGYELRVHDNAWLYNLKYRECSLAIAKHEVAFVSNGGTIGTATCQEISTVTPPAASRDGDYRFLGYFTEETGGEQIFNANCECVQGPDSEWTPSDGATLYAQWDSPRTFTFVSVGTAVGSASGYADDPSFAVPIPSRTDGFTFLGYYTEGGRRVFDASGAPVQGGLSGLPQDVTLYARWMPPATSIPALDCSTIVYRGQLNLLGTDQPAADAKTYVKTMHFKAYADETAETPAWEADDRTVTVNSDGSFTVAIGDEALAALIATGGVTHVGVAIGPSAGQAIELKPRRALRPVAAVNRALVAEAAGKDPRVGNLVTENALVAENVTVSRLEVAGTVTAPGAEKVTVSPVVVGAGETLTLLRGDGVKVFSGKRVELARTGAVQRGEKLGNPAPSDGIALIASRSEMMRGLRIPGVVQYCRKGEYARAPATEPDGVLVTFFPFAGEE